MHHFCHYQIFISNHSHDPFLHLSFVLKRAVLRCSHTAAAWVSASPSCIDNPPTVQSCQPGYWMCRQWAVTFFQYEDLFSSDPSKLLKKWASFIWPLWVTSNKQMIFKPCRCLRGKPVIGCNPVLLSSPDGRKCQRRVRVDNGYTETSYKSLILSNIYPLPPKCNWLL